MNETAKNGLFWLAATAILALGLALRLYAGRGDLWLDEIWTLHLLKQVTRPGQVFWKINHDNNHYLNSLWMFALGPYRASLAYRMPSVLFGTAAIAAAGAWGLRRGRTAAILAMLLFAVSYFMIDLTSQARGYAGLILSVVVALLLTEDALQGKERGPFLGFVILFGVLNHLLMFFCAAILAAWAYMAMAERRGPGYALRFTILLFLPGALLVLPLFGWIVYTITHHIYVIGAPQPYTPAALPAVFGRTIEATVALPRIDAAMTYTFAAIFAVMAYSGAARDDLRQKLYLIAVLGLPALLFFGQIPNTGQPRYFLICGIVFLLMLGDAGGLAWRGSGKRRGVAMAIAALLLAGDATLLAPYLRDGRGHYGAALTAIAVDGPTLYGGDDDNRNPIVEQYYIDRLHLPIRHVPMAQWCTTPPQFLLLYDHSHSKPAPSLNYGPAACVAKFDRPQDFPAWGFSGINWIVYRRAP